MSCRVRTLKRRGWLYWECVDSCEECEVETHMDLGASEDTLTLGLQLALRSYSTPRPERIRATIHIPSPILLHSTCRGMSLNPHDSSTLPSCLHPACTGSVGAIQLKPEFISRLVLRTFANHEYSPVGSGSAAAGFVSRARIMLESFDDGVAGGWAAAPVRCQDEPVAHCCSLSLSLGAWR